MPPKNYTVRGLIVDMNSKSVRAYTPVHVRTHLHCAKQGSTAPCEDVHTRRLDQRRKTMSGRVVSISKHARWIRCQEHASSSPLSETSTAKTPSINLFVTNVAAAPN